MTVGGNLLADVLYAVIDPASDMAAQSINRRPRGDGLSVAEQAPRARTRACAAT